MNPSVAIIDIGSNSIKSLVASRVDSGEIETLAAESLDARISAGISRAEPRLGAEGMARGLDAIRTLLAQAAPFGPAKTVLVATSAVRDAQNGGAFRARVHAATGHEIRILTGEEEANLIGRGLTTDPALAALRDFHVLDLGGGSLECLAFCDRRIVRAASLQLGCVRLTEKFVADPAAPFSAEAGAEIARHVRAELARVGYEFGLRGAAAVGTGGTLATVRAILGERAGVAFEATSALVTVETLHELLRWLGALPLDARRKISGLPPERADVFPTALATIIAVAEVG
ncbi:MAG: hypothetical protein RLZZ15_2194, partial [Verrucomicrobiota bacterium]